MRGPPHKIQNTDQSKTKHLHYLKRTVHKGNIPSKLDSTPLIVIHPIVVNLYIFFIRINLNCLLFPYFSKSHIISDYLVQFFLLVENK